MKNLTAMVENVLEKDEASRNSDIRLLKVVWNTYFKGYLFKAPEDNELSVKLKYFDTLPREDHLKRIRAVIQNEEGRFLPTTEKVRKQRRISELKWLDYLKNQI